MTRLILPVVAALLSGGIAVAGQQGAAARKLFVKVVNAQGFATRIVYLSKNMTATVAGDPVANGASFHVGFPGGEDECISLPSSKWQATAGGFRFRDRTSPLRAVIKRSQTGNFRLKLVATHAGIHPPARPPRTSPTSRSTPAATNTARAGSATPTKNDATTFLVKNDDGTVCQAACSSPSGAFVDASTAF
jgi:hypothetical protein